MCVCAFQDLTVCSVVGVYQNQSAVCVFVYQDQTAVSVCAERVCLDVAVCMKTLVCAVQCLCTKTFWQ